MMIDSNCKIVGQIELPRIVGEFSMIPFNLETLKGLPNEFIGIARQLLKNVEAKGIGYFTLHGKELKASQSLRRGGAHIDGNYDKTVMDWGIGGGGGWKVNDSRPISEEAHKRLYHTNKGGIILASNYPACIGWKGKYEGLPNQGGDCSHINLDTPFTLEKNTVYYGNNEFIHESLPVNEDVHRVFARITLPITHEYPH